MNFYVYRLDDPITCQFYFGSRSCNCNPTDDPYMGSMKTWKPDDTSRLIKTILKTGFDNVTDMIKCESNIINKNIDNPLNENYYIPTKGFHTLGRKRPQNELDRLSEIHSGKTMSPESRQKISEATKGENNPMYGRKHSKDSIEKMRVRATGRKYSDETKRKLSELHSGTNHHYYGKKRTELHKPILQYSKDMIFIKEWDYIKDAGDTLGISSGNISNCCIGRIKTYKGFIWKYKFKTR